MSEPTDTLAATGIAGLDDILGGGLTPNRIYLVEGDPGTGKTTLALQYLLEGARLGERGMYVTLSETKEELQAVSRSHGWSLDAADIDLDAADIDIVELVASEDSLQPNAQYTMFHPSEVELSETTRTVLSEVERVKPARVVFDSLSEMRLLAQNPLRYRRQILALKQFFIGRRCTVLLLDDKTAEAGDLNLHSLAHGVISLEQLAPEYGAERRRLRVVKLRGRRYRGGYHDFTIVPGGLLVFPRLVAAEHHGDFDSKQLKSGVAGLDALLGGGLDRGTSMLLMGPAGVGKSSVATQYAQAVAEGGEAAMMFIFDENRRTLLARAAEMGADVSAQLEAGRITVQQVDPAELSPGEFAAAVRQAVARGVKLIVIDSLNGYLQAMPEERFLIVQLHELLTYLSQQGVTTLLVVGQHGLLSNTIHTPVDVSYLSDTVLLFRYFEAQGVVRKALTVIKKRSGKHELSIRELRMDKAGLRVGEPLRQFHGILSGMPNFAGLGESLLSESLGPEAHDRS